MADHVQRDITPLNRVTEIGGDALDFIEAHALFDESDRVIVLITEAGDGYTGEAGVSVGGYHSFSEDLTQDTEGDHQLVMDMLEHLKAICKAAGINIGIASVPGKGQG